MLYVILGIVVLVTIILCYCDYTEHDYESAIILANMFICFGLAVLMVFFLVLYSYNSVKSTTDKKIHVLQEQNDTIIEQTTPLIEKYLKYENETLKELKLTPQTLIALSAYPELEGNSFIQTQINIIVKNQNEITSLKLKKASLNSYRLWIFMGED